MLNARIPPLAAVALIAATFAGAGFCELHAVSRAERRAHPTGAQTRKFCLSCHSGPEWIAKIAAKAGKKPTDRLFVDDPPAPPTATPPPHAFAYRLRDVTVRAHAGL